MNTEMKKYISFFAALLAVVCMTSCQKETEGLTQITYYANIELDGPLYDQATAGVPYKDPGFTATMQGENINSQVKISSDMDLNNPKPGYYKLTYTAINKDGFPASASRFVLVASPDDKASGYYATSPKSFRLRDGATVYYGASFNVIVYGDGTGTYKVSDFLGGWYEYRSGYGSNYAAAGSFSLADDGTMTLLSSQVPGWGDSLSALNDGKFDAETETFSWQAVYAGMGFNVTMNKQ